MKKKNVQAMLTGMAVMMSVMLPTTSVLAAVPEKEQTVYVNADENGKSENVIVSNWLKNIDGDTQLTDKSELNNIQNVKGDEGFKQGSDSSLTWDANGKDLLSRRNNKGTSCRCKSYLLFRWKGNSTF